MQRDYGNELIAAVAAVALVAFAVTFGILLSVSDTGEEEATATVAAQIASETFGSPDSLTSSETNTALATATERPSPTPTEETVPTDTPVPADTATLIPTDTATHTQTPTRTTTVTSTTTSTGTPTETPLPTDTPTATHTATLTPTVTGTATPTEMPSSTNTSTLTPTLAPTRTVSPTETPSPTHTATRTLIPSATHTRVPTNTPRPTDMPKPTEMLLPTATSTRTSTRTASLTRTPTRTPPTPTIMATPLGPTRTPLGDNSLGILPTDAGVEGYACEPPEDWPVYVVEPRTTLFTIALAVNTTVGELRDANCIDDVDRIRVGDTLYVPRPPTRPVATFVPSGSATPDSGDGADMIPVGCTDPAVYISSPSAGQTVSAFTPITGTAAIYNFLFYRIEIRPEGAATYDFYTRSDSPVFGNVLGHLDTEPFPGGIYWIRLAVFDVNGNVPDGATCAIPIRLE